MNVNQRTAFWKWFYRLLIGTTVAGLVLYFWLGRNTLLISSVMVWMVIAILGSNATHQAEKSSRRHTAPPKAAEYPEADEVRSFRRQQARMNLENWNTNDHTEPPATGGK